MDDLQPTEEALFADFPPTPTRAWEAKIQEDLRDASYKEALVWTAPDGFEVAPYYRAEDLADVQLDSYPQTPEGAPWQIRQDILHEDLGEANRLARNALDGGAEAIGFTLDVGGKAGRGVPVRTAADLGRLLAGIDLGSVPLHLDAGRTSGEALAMLLETAKAPGTASASLNGSLAYPPLGLSAETPDIRADVTP